MTFYADLSSDIPASYKRKRVILYRQGLKIYGLLPYILQRKLKAQFFSNAIRTGNVLISAGSFEANWTAVSYRQANLDALLDWLYSDAGFEAAIASEEDWNDDIFSANMFRSSPATWYPVGNEARSGFFQVKERRDIARLLALPEGKQ